MTLFFFDFDKTLYSYDFRMRLPALSLITGLSQYHLAKSWWAGGFEHRAEAGEWPTPDEYFAQFELVTGAPLTQENYLEARELATTPISGSIAALEHAAGLGTAALLSNNPSPFPVALPRMAPDVIAIVGDNLAISCELGARKPDAEAYQRALRQFGATAEETFFADDSAENIAGAVAVGITGHQLTYVDGVPQVDALLAAIDRFAASRAS